MIGGDRRNNLYDKAIEFSKKIVFLYRELENRKVEKELSKQLLRCGTSIGANISEAQGSISEADYVSKIHIAFKELIETRYWLELLYNTADIKELEFNEMNEKYSELSKILYTIIKNIRQKRSNPKT